MGLISWFQKAFSPAKLTAGTPVVQGKPLWEQFSRIGGGITPLDVSNLIRQADAGQPASFVDLTFELRQKDSQFQSACGTRDRAVALVDLEFVEPKDATPAEKEAVETCRRVRDDFENWPTLIEHLTSSYLFGHATAEVSWKKTSDGLVLPYKAQAINARDFIFRQSDGALRYRVGVLDSQGADLLGDNPGRIVQLQRRITGDVAAREGLARVINWAALLRNWDLRDWVAFGEIGWKPWRIGTFKAGAHQKDIDDLVSALERIGSTGIGAFPEATEAKIEWPKGSGSGTSVHRELFDTLGREIAKCVIGTSTTLDAGPNGDRGGVAARDQVRTDVRESDARAVAAALRYQLFVPVVAVNHGDKVRAPVPWFQTEEAADRKEFSEAVMNLVESGAKIPAKWVSDEVGYPLPIEGEDVLEKAAPVAVQVPGKVGEGEPEEDDDEPEEAEVDSDNKGEYDEPIGEPGKGPSRRLTKAAGDVEEPSNGREYTDRVESSLVEAGAKAIAPTLASVLAAIEKAQSYNEARALMLQAYRGMEPPRNLAQLTEAALLLAQAGGALSVNEETPELTGGP